MTSILSPDWPEQNLLDTTRSANVRTAGARVEVFIEAHADFTQETAFTRDREVLFGEVAIGSSKVAL